jgi:hypothetical protein
VREKLSVNFDELGDRKRGAKIKISQVDRAEERVSGDDGVEEEVDGG